MAPHGTPDVETEKVVREDGPRSRSSSACSSNNTLPGTPREQAANPVSKALEDIVCTLLDPTLDPQGATAQSTLTSLFDRHTTLSTPRILNTVLQCLQHPTMVNQVHLLERCLRDHDVALTADVYNTLLVAYVSTQRFTDALRIQCEMQHGTIPIYAKTMKAVEDIAVAACETPSAPQTKSQPQPIVVEDDATLSKRVQEYDTDEVDPVPPPSLKRQQKQMLSQYHQIILEVLRSSSSESWTEALQLKRSIETVHNMVPLDATYNSLLAHAPNEQEFTRIIADMNKKGVRMVTRHVTSCIKSLLRYGKAQLAAVILDKGYAEGLQIEISAYNLMLNALTTGSFQPTGRAVTGNGTNMEAVEKYVESILKNHIPPTTDTFAILQRVKRPDLVQRLRNSFQ